MSHSLSLNDPLRLRESRPAALRGAGNADRLRHHAARGTSSGDKKPDLILSGVNRGHNVAEDVIYSGTIAGAMEGVILGIPSFALSQEFGVDGRRNPALGDWTQARPGYHQGGAAPRAFPRTSVINIEFPELRGRRRSRASPWRAPGKRITQGFLRIDERRDGSGNPYYWIGF